MPGVLGVLLAAGTGSRFDGRNKLLAPLDGDHVVRHSARALLSAPVDDRIAVLGYEADRVAEALADLDVETVHNPDYAAGQATSVAVGARVAAERDATAAVFHLGDMPCVRPATIRALLDAADGSDAGIVVPTFEGRRGNPVLFGAEHFDRLQDVSGDTGGRVLFERYPVERVPVDDPGIHRDVDTEADLEALRAACES
ncbi:nucleotidyltransferase family protein [Haloarchaeobius sp. HRN-SO-5]|uniref:nucleotidyltransferase family protein n=1 Tax=Haloarchaeobius sp. HRN-SO-5 TaxID=3446118 RepID=UPI003EB7C4B6